MNELLERQIQHLMNQTSDDLATIEIIAKDEMIWTTRKWIASIFVVGVSAILKHLANIFSERELDKKLFSPILGTSCGFTNQ